MLNNKLFKIIIVLSVIIWCISCKTVTQLETGKIRDQDRFYAPFPSPVPSHPQNDSEKRTQEIPEISIQRLAMPAMEIPNGDKTYNVQLRDADLLTVLQGIAAQSGLNVIFGADIENRTLSLNMEEVRLDALLKCILKTADLAYDIEDDVIRITETGTRAYQINYPASAGLGFGGQSGAGGGQGSFSSPFSRGGSSQQGSQGTETDFWDSLEETLKSLKSDRGLVTVNPVSGIIILKDSPERLDSMELFLKRFQSSVQRQVVIEALIVELALDDEYQMGIDWSFSNVGLDWLSPHTAGRMTQSLGIGGGAYQFTITSDHATLLLDALGSQGKLNILSKPLLAVLNNQPAYINVTEQIPYYSAVVSTETDKIVGWDISFAQAGIQVQVIPQISETGQIILFVNPVISELVGYTDPGRTTNAAPLPIIDVREASTVIKVSDNQAAVIGGLMKRKKTEAVSLVPGLGNLPWIGTLFRRTIQTHRNSELVLFLQPRIIWNERTSFDEVHRLDERLQKSREGFYFGPEHKMFQKERHFDANPDNNLNDQESSQGE